MYTRSGFNTVRSQLIAVLSVFIFSSAVSFAEPMNLSLLRKEIEVYYDAGHYEKELTRILNEARQYIVQEALNNKKQSKPKKLALVLDIDETSLSNYKKIIKRDFISVHEQIHQEILAADSPPMPGMLALYQAALDHGIDIFFITGRRESEQEATRTNLLRAGFKNWAKLYVRPEVYQHQSIIPFKTEVRKEIAAQGYTIIASIGDQQSDLEGGYMQRGFKLPNPFYFLP